MGGTKMMAQSELRSIVKQVSKKWPAAQYDLLARNCNQFTTELCAQLDDAGKPDDAAAAATDASAAAALSASLSAALSGSGADEGTTRFRPSVRDREPASTAEKGPLRP